MAEMASGFLVVSLGPVAYTPSAYFWATLMNVSSFTPSSEMKKIFIPFLRIWATIEEASGW